jgi:hypothetical protein
MEKTLSNVEIPSPEEGWNVRVCDKCLEARI